MQEKLTRLLCKQASCQRRAEKDGSTQRIPHLSHKAFGSSTLSGQNKYYGATMQRQENANANTLNPIAGGQVIDIKHQTVEFDSLSGVLPVLGGSVRIGQGKAGIDPFFPIAVRTFTVLARQKAIQELPSIRGTLAKPMLFYISRLPIWKGGFQHIQF